MSNGRARVSARNRWLSTTWKMSPALMHSTALRTAASNSGRVKLEPRLARPGRQPRQVRGAVRGEHLLEHPQRVGRRRLDPPPVPLPGAGAGAVRLERAERAGPEEAVAADPLAADDALEQERPVPLLDLAERGHR